MRCFYIIVILRKIKTYNINIKNLNFIKNAGILYLKVPAFYNDCY